MEMEPTFTISGLCQVAPAIPVGCSETSAAAASGGHRVSIQIQTLGSGTCTIPPTGRTGTTPPRHSGFPSGVSRTTAFRSYCLFDYLIPRIYPVKCEAYLTGAAKFFLILAMCLSICRPVKDYLKFTNFAGTFCAVTCKSCIDKMYPFGHQHLAHK